MSGHLVAILQYFNLGLPGIQSGNFLGDVFAHEVAIFNQGQPSLFEGVKISLSQSHLVMKQPRTKNSSLKLIFKSSLLRIFKLYDHMSIIQFFGR